MGRASPWAQQANNDWRAAGYQNNNAGIDDVQRALSTLEIAGNGNQMYQNNQAYMVREFLAPIVRSPS
jgi:hypothetical protein